MSPAPNRSATIAIIGAPNAGKSTLVNRCCGAKVSIVTPKAQTTRRRALGIVTHGDAQLVFIDTPGIFDARGTFEKTMVQAARGSLEEADVILLLVDAKRPGDLALERCLSFLPQCEATKILVLNKVDATPKETLPPLAADLFAKASFDRCFMISAKRGDGVEDVLKYLAGMAKTEGTLFPEENYTDQSERAIAAEITREKLFLALRQEIPYGLNVETETWEEKRDGSVKISQVILVENEKHKKIIVGKHGAMLKKVGEQSRQSLSRLLGRPAHLFLFVKVAERWKEEFTASS